MWFDPDHPLLRPMWVRLLLVAIPLIAAAASFANGSVGWSLPFIAAGAFLFQRLVLTPGVEDGGDDEDGR